MPVTELVIASIKPPHQLPSESTASNTPFATALKSLRNVQRTLSGFPVYLFTSIEREQDRSDSPTNVFILAGWSSPSAHYASVSTPAHQAIVSPLLEFLELESMVHVGVDFEAMKNALHGVFELNGEKEPSTIGNLTELHSDDVFLVISKGTTIVPEDTSVASKLKWNAHGPNLDQEVENPNSTGRDVYHIAIYHGSDRNNLLEKIDVEGAEGKRDVWVMKPLEI
ncbi:hypothetical protein VKT23_010500 [Stygiomarasmius scandens]|uniref:Uncharacterized protein n=1 Tax=Marasmiellus scandens TaxID=2682957 RepID=A0ABR1JCP3_9AGAR